MKRRLLQMETRLSLIKAVMNEKTLTNRSLVPTKITALGSNRGVVLWSSYLLLSMRFITSLV